MSMDISVPVVKKVLCRHWVTKGKCDLESSCKFAHGTAELAQPSQVAPQSGMMIGGGGVSYKTKMCKTFLATKACPLGPKCHFAHGQAELRNMYRPPNAGVTPGVVQQYGNFKAKTVLCKNWKEKGECSYGDRCSFAHGEDQIRGSGQPPPPGEVEPKEQMIQRNPLYKTTICKKFTEAEFCDMGEDCHFAHGKDELRTIQNPSQGHSGGSGGNPGKVGPQYKTTMCKSFSELGSCEYGQHCLFAHGQEELRPVGTQVGFKQSLCKNWESNGSCTWGEQCKWAHGSHELNQGSVANKGGSRGPSVGPGHGQGANGRVTSPQYKTVMCQQFQEKGFCTFRDTCNFAHGHAEMRTVQENLARINPNYKGTLCKYFMSTGDCEFGSLCQYAHGNLELRAVNPSAGSSLSGNQNYNSLAGMVGFSSPQYKTTLCKNYQDHGKCDFGARCQFAHGQLELRTLAQNYIHLNPAYKTKMCPYFMEGGASRCPVGVNCQDSHGPQELRAAPFSPSGGPATVGAPTPSPAYQGLYGHPGIGARPDTTKFNRQSSNNGNNITGASYKTQLCKNIREKGSCSYGSACQFAHSTEELSSAPVPMTSSSKPVKVVMCEKMSKTGHCDRGAFCDFAHNLEELQLNRALQVPNYKTTLCKSFSSRGTCEYGETCMYAHGEQQLRKMRQSNSSAPSFSGFPDPKRIRM